MTFTYLGDLSTDLDKVRFYIGDTVDGSGVRPNDGNFTDEEITALVAYEGDINAAVGALYERLAADWGRYVDTKIGPRDEKLSQIADRYTKLAKEWRNKPAATADSAELKLNFFDMEIDRDTS